MIPRHWLPALLLGAWLPAAADAPEAAAQCQCLWHGSFAEVQASADLVIAGTVLSSKGNSIDLAAQRIMAGREHLPEIRIWLQARDYCRPPVETFPPGSSWVMALERIEEAVPGGFDPDTPNISYGRVGDYKLSSCGGYWLDLNEGWVEGNLVNGPRWARDVKMTPVMLDLLAEYVAGRVPVEALVEASREDPALRELMLDTRQFLRRERRGDAAGDIEPAPENP